MNIDRWLPGRKGKPKRSETSNWENKTMRRLHVQTGQSMPTGRTGCPPIESRYFLPLPTGLEVTTCVIRLVPMLPSGDRAPEVTVPKVIPQFTNARMRLSPGTREWRYAKRPHG
jgi:hypothetical protein